MFQLLFCVIGIDDALILGGIMAATSTGGSFLGSWLGNRNSKKQISRDAFLNYAYGLQMAENGPSATVRGLRKAGLNPILAASDGSFSTPKMPSVSGSGAPNGSETGTAMANLVLNSAQVNSNVALAKTQQDLNKATTFKSFADGLTTLKTGGLKGGYAALKSFASDFLGIRDKDSSDLLKSFGFGPDTVSTPDGSSRPRSEVISRSTAGDGKDITSPVPGGDPNFKPNYSNNNKVGKFFNDIDKSIADDNYRKGYEKNSKLVKPNKLKEEAIRKSTKEMYRRRYRSKGGHNSISYR